MRRTLLWLIVTVVLVIGFVLFRSRAKSRLNVMPDAEREIERAKRH